MPRRSQPRPTTSGGSRRGFVHRRRGGRVLARRGADLRAAPVVQRQPGRPRGRSGPGGRTRPVPRRGRDRASDTTIHPRPRRASTGRAYGCFPHLGKGREPIRRSRSGRSWQPSCSTWRPTRRNTCGRRPAATRTPRSSSSPPGRGRRMHVGYGTAYERGCSISTPTGASSAPKSGRDRLAPRAGRGAALRARSRCVTDVRVR